MTTTYKLPFELESDARDMSVQLGPEGVTITMLGHPWRVIETANPLHPNQSPLQLRSMGVEEGGVEGHDMYSEHPSDCPGCSEFVKK